MGEEHQFTLLKNYPMERKFTLRKELRNSIFDSLKALLFGK
jgi:hypothetical protein